MKPKPPDGHLSWLDYAVVTMDTRDLFNEQFMDDKPYWGRIIQREEMRQAAREELAALRWSLSALEERDKERREGKE